MGRAQGQALTGPADLRPVNPRMYVIAHNGSPVYGGGEIWIARLLAGLNRRGHRVLLYCRRQDVATRAAAEGIETRVQHLGGDVAIWDAVAFARALRAERPDALVLTTFKKIWLGGMAARMARVPRVVYRLGIGGLRARNITYSYPLRHWIDAVVPNNESLCAPFAAGLPETVARRVRAIWDGVTEPPTTRPPGAVRGEIGIPTDALVIGTVARLWPQKRLDRFVGALAALSANVHGVVAGEGHERESLERLGRRLGVAQRLHLLGYRADVGDVLAAFDVFVLTSDYEGIANAMLEAMAAGVPVVSTPVEGAREALFSSADYGAPGLVTSFELDDITAVIRELLDEPDLRAAMSRAGRRRVQERFGFERMVDEWEALLGAAAPA